MTVQNVSAITNQFQQLLHDLKMQSQSPRSALELSYMPFQVTRVFTLLPNT